MEILRMVSELLTQEIADPRIHNVTVKNVVLTSDAGLARVYYDVDLPEPERKALRKALDHAKGFIRRKIATRLELRTVPQVEFFNE